MVYSKNIMQWYRSCSRCGKELHLNSKEDRTTTCWDCSKTIRNERYKALLPLLIGAKVIRCDESSSTDSDQLEGIVLELEDGRLCDLMATNGRYDGHVIEWFIQDKKESK